MKQLTREGLKSFLATKPAAAIHFDAEWDVGHRPTLRARMLEAENAFGERANFLEADIDRNQELARSLHILNVPAVAYYRGGKLVTVLVGSHQDIRALVERVLRGQPI